MNSAVIKELIILGHKVQDSWQCKSVPRISVWTVQFNGWYLQWIILFTVKVI